MIESLIACSFLAQLFYAAADSGSQEAKLRLKHVDDEAESQSGKRRRPKDKDNQALSDALMQASRRPLGTVGQLQRAQTDRLSKSVAVSSR